MQDERIIELYFMRDESAIEHTEYKYGSFCRAIADRILGVYEDSEECVSDTWLRAWSKMPPERPLNLKAWLGRITRNLSIDRWNKEHAKKRYTGAQVLLDELKECVPSSFSVEHECEVNELSQAIERWLKSLDKQDRVLFMRRYWYAISVNDLAIECKANAKTVASKLYRLRKSLKRYLEKEGISI